MMRKVSSPAMVPTTSRVVEVVDLPGDRGRRTDLAAHHEQLLRDERGAREVAQHVARRLLRVLGPLAGAEHVLGAAEVRADLLQVELADVARDRGLRDLAAERAEGAHQLALGGHLALLHHGLDEALALGLAHRCATVHADRLPPRVCRLRRAAPEHRKRHGPLHRIHQLRLGICNRPARCGRLAARSRRHLGAAAGVGEDLEQHGVLDAAVDDVGAAHAGLQRPAHGRRLGEHAAGDAAGGHQRAEVGEVALGDRRRSRRPAPRRCPRRR